MNLEYDYQKSMYYKLINSSHLYMENLRRSGKNMLQRYIVIHILENRLKNFHKNEFEKTERKFYTYLGYNTNLFVCGKEEYDIAVQDILKMEELNEKLYNKNKQF